MAAFLPQQMDTGPGPGPGVPGPPWIQGPHTLSTPCVGGPRPSTFQVLAANSSTSFVPMPPRAPGLVPSRPLPSFRFALPMQAGQQQFTPSSSQQFGTGVAPSPGMVPQIGMPPPSLPSFPTFQLQATQYSQMTSIPTQQLQAPPASRGISVPFSQLQRSVAGGLPPLQTLPQSMSMPLPRNLEVPLSASFQYVSSINYPQPQNTTGVPPVAFRVQTQHQQVQGIQPGAQAWPMVSGEINAVVPSEGVKTDQSNSVGVNSVQGPMASGVCPGPAGSSEWQEHISPDGRRYYYNKKTKRSSWERPLELMTPTERADASTLWKEFTSADGRKYFYNRVTKQSTWVIPEEMKLAREKVENVANSAATSVTLEGAAFAGTSPARVDATSAASALVLPSSDFSGITTNMVSGSPTATVIPIISSTAESIVVDAAPSLVDTVAEMNADKKTVVNFKEEVLEEELVQSIEGADESCGDAIVTSSTTTHDEEEHKAMPLNGKNNVIPVPEDKLPHVAEEPLSFANKTDAKNAFKELLEAVHVESDWTWEQAMRVIINDKRYGALKTLGERKQAFNEHLAQRRKQETEEKRFKQKKAREDFLAMLQESEELMSTMRWSKVTMLFADDSRFHAVERDREREELFEDYAVQLEHKERERAREGRKKNLIQYRALLESCDFIKANTQWRKVHDKLENDERCSCLDKIDQLEGFQEYIRDLEKQEDEDKKIQKEHHRRNERKNRDEFRKLLEEHRSSGFLTARVCWRDYSFKIKDHPAYLALCANSSGSTAKELFDDVFEELEKQYHEDKLRVKDFIKAVKIVVTPAWTFDKFKAVTAEACDFVEISEPNLKLVFEDLLDRAWEKEEKEEKKWRHLVDDFNALLHSEKTFGIATKWEDAKMLLESAPVYRALSDELACKKLFDEYVAHLQQKAKGKERKQGEKVKKQGKETEKKEKEKENRKEKEKKFRERDEEKLSKLEKGAIADINKMENNNFEREERRRDKGRDRDREKDRKHRKCHRSRSSDDKKETCKLPNDRKRSSQKHAHESASDLENMHKRHRRDYNRLYRSGKAEELEDGELGEDGEIQ